MGVDSFLFNLLDHSDNLTFELLIDRGDGLLLTLAFI